MSLFLPPAPDGTAEAIAHGLRRARAAGHLTLPGPAAAAVVVTPVAPHRVYTMGRDALLEGRGLAAARPAGWRAIVLQGGEAVAAVEFKGVAGDAHNFKSVNQGSLVEATAVAIAAAELLPEVKAEHYELRLLSIPAIRLVALWLHGSDGQLFLPLAPAPGHFKAHTPYGEAHFFELASALAARQAKFDDRPEGEPPAPGGTR